RRALRSSAVLRETNPAAAEAGLAAAGNHAVAAVVRMAAAPPDIAVKLPNTRRCNRFSLGRSCHLFGVSGLFLRQRICNPCRGETCSPAYLNDIAPKPPAG